MGGTRSGAGYEVLIERLPGHLLDGLERAATSRSFREPHPRAGRAFAWADLDSAPVADVVEEWIATPGEVILLDGWAPGADDDPRPFHRVDPPTTGELLMFQLRRNVAVEGPWPDELTDTERDQARGLARDARS